HAAPRLPPRLRFWEHDVSTVRLVGGPPSRLALRPFFRLRLLLLYRLLLLAALGDAEKLTAARTRPAAQLPVARPTALRARLLALGARLLDRLVLLADLLAAQPDLAVAHV